MTVKDIIKLTAVLLGRENIVLYNHDDKADSNTLYQVDVLTRCTNLVVNELASTYVPMIKREQVNSNGGKVNFSELSENALKILKVYDVNGNELECKFHPEYLQANKSVGEILYRYIPSNYGYTDIMGYKETEVPARIIAYGVTAEYCLTERMFEDACAWHKKYMDGIAEICSPKNVTLKKRSFV